MPLRLLGQADWMAYEIGFEDERATVVITVRERIDLDEFKAALRGLREVREARGAARVLWDLREASLSSLSAEHVRELSAYQSLVRSGLPRSAAVFLVTKDIDYGIARMLCSHVNSDEVNCRVFRDVNQAQQWLGESIG